MKPKCENCRHWEATQIVGRPPDNTRGECHRFPPVVVTHITAAGLICRFPLTPAHEFCGEHAPLEVYRRNDGDDGRGGL